MLSDQADKHVPLAAISQGLMQQPSHHSIVYGAVGGLDDRFQDVVRPLHLVPEHHIALAEFELLDVEQVLGLRSKQVQASEHPAASGASLVGDAPIVQQGGKGVSRFGNDIAVQSHIIHIVLGNHILHQLMGRLRLKGLLKTGE